MKEGLMANRKNRDPIPKHFKSIKEAAEFWDTHDLGDYWDLTREVEFELRAKRGRRVTLDPVSDCKVIVSILQSIIL
jgi:hypothetical protein